MTNAIPLPARTLRPTSPQATQARREEMKHEKRNIIDRLFNYREPDPVEALQPQLPDSNAP